MIAAAVGTFAGTAEFLFWVLPGEWLNIGAAFLPFAAVPAVIGAALVSRFRKKEVQQ